MKAVICAAGYGSRLFPVTKTIPKEMLPILNKPCIDFIIEELVHSGITNILIIHSRRKKALEDYFDKDIELETCIQDPQKLAQITPHSNHNTLNLSFIRQKEMKGTGHALLLAKDYIQESPFILAYPDDIIFAKTPLSQQLINTYYQKQCPIIASLEYHEADINSYGVICSSDQYASIKKVQKILEKPTEGTHNSQHISIGRYLLTPTIFSLLEKNYTLHPKDKEFYLTDTLNEYAQMHDLYALDFDGVRYDVGKVFGYLQAITSYALHHTDYKDKYLHFLQHISKT